MTRPPRKDMVYKRPRYARDVSFYITSALFAISAAMLLCMPALPFQAKWFTVYAPVACYAVFLITSTIGVLESATADARAAARYAPFCWIIGYVLAAVLVIIGRYYPSAYLTIGLLPAFLLIGLSGYQMKKTKKAQGAAEAVVLSGALFTERQSTEAGKILTSTALSYLLRGAYLIFAAVVFRNLPPWAAFLGFVPALIIAAVFRVRRVVLLKKRVEPAKIAIWILELMHSGLLLYALCAVMQAESLYILRACLAAVIGVMTFYYDDQYENYDVAKAMRESDTAA